MPKVPNKNYTAVGTYIFAGGFTVGVKSAGFDVKCHLEGDKYGVSTFKTNYPDIPVYVGKENWPDELPGKKVDFIYGNPPCLTPDTKVLTEDGWERIDGLVKSRSTKSVATVEGEKIIYRPIDDWHENPYNGLIFGVTMTHGGKSVRGPARVHVTENHKFMTKRGWVEARHLQPDDLVATGEPAPDKKQQSIITGMLLGDGSISRQPQFKTGQTCHELVDLKRQALSTLGAKTHVSVLAGKEFNDGSPRKDKLELYTKTGVWVKQERLRWYPNGKKVVPDDIELTPMVLAVWYMDDGRGRNQKWSGQEKYASRRITGPWAELATHNFSDDDLTVLIKKLQQMGLTATRRVRKSGYVDLLIKEESATKFFNMIGKYVCPEMRYKLPDGSPDFDESEWECGEPETGWDTVSVKFIRENKWAKVYCLGIPGPQNFITRSGVVHNCAAWSGNNPASHQAGSWEQDPRVNCTRNHFALLEKHRPKVWAWESVCAAPTKGAALVNELTQKAMALGYSVSQVFHEAMYLGCPQTRKRWFLVCHNVEFFPEEPDWYGVTSAVKALQKVKPCETIGYDTRMNKDVYVKHLSKMKPGMRLRTLFEKVLQSDLAKRVVKDNGHVKGRPNFGGVKLKDKGPSTATVGYAMIHPTQDRFLSVREVAVLAGFPPTYKFLGGELGNQQIDLIARGVCPPVGAWLARSVKDSLDKNIKVKRPVLRVYDFRAKDIEPVIIPTLPATAITTL